jgi:hypothetical protein
LQVSELGEELGAASIEVSDTAEKSSQFIEGSSLRTQQNTKHGT